MLHFGVAGWSLRTANVNCDCDSMRQLTGLTSSLIYMASYTSILSALGVLVFKNLEMPDESVYSVGSESMFGPLYATIESSKWTHCVLVPPLNADFQLFARGGSLKQSDEKRDSFARSSLYSFRHMAFSNSKIAYVAVPKAWSSATKQFLNEVGELVDEPFKLTYGSVQQTGLCAQHQLNRTCTLPVCCSEFVSGTMEHKIVFTSLREPLARLDSAAGTTAKRLGLRSRSRVVVAHVHFKPLIDRYAEYGVEYHTPDWVMPQMLPQTFFLNRLPRNTRVLLVGPRYEDSLKELVSQVYPSLRTSSITVHQLNVKEGRDGSSAPSFVEYARTNNYSLLKDYDFDSTLFTAFEKAGC